MRVVAVPCLKDNFAYLVIDEASKRCAVVDPGEAAPVVAAVAREHVELVAVWATHHHYDHVGGVPDLLKQHPKLQVIIGDGDAAKVPTANVRLSDGNRFTLGDLRGHVIHNPGHTLGAISYVVEGCVFTGDTLFGAGCGRLFEGDAAMMFASLNKLASLPGETRVYFGHEYTATNLRFAAAVEPDNTEVAARAHELPAPPTPSTPSTIELERITNPFLRTREREVITAAMERGSGGDPVSVFAAIRSWKDNFR